MSPLTGEDYNTECQDPNDAPARLGTPSPGNADLVDGQRNENVDDGLRTHYGCENGLVGWEEHDETDMFERVALEDLDGESDDDDDDEGFGNRPQHHGHRLVFSTKKLYGREKELETLEDLYHQMIVASNAMPESSSSSSTTTSPMLPSEVVYLSGYSGSGKTSLANAFVDRIRTQQESDASDPEHTVRLMYIHGKYEESLPSVPYRGISEAFERWFMGLSMDDRESVFKKNKRVEQDLNEAVGGDVEVLKDILPNVGRYLLGKEASNCSTSQLSTVALGTRLKSVTDDPISKVRLHNVFQAFIRCLCTKETPMVLFCDDLQWADSYSLELLLSILSDSSLGHFFCILAARSNEVDEDHRFSKTLTSLVQVRQIQMISVKGLPQDSIAEFIADTLGLDPKGVAPLTTAVYQRSLGNILYTKQALDQLTRTNALYFDVVVFRWQWLLTEKELENLLSTDILEMVIAKIKALPLELQQALMVAAYTRSSIAVDTLLEILNTEDNDNQIPLRDNWRIVYFPYTTERLCKLLDFATEEGLLTKSANELSCTSFQYIFAHDRIREAACRLITGEELHSLFIRIGNVLAKRGLNQAFGEEWMLFTAVHCLNAVPLSYHSEEGRLRLARLNLEAAKLSFGRAAFEDALSYTEEGIMLLPFNRWETNGDLCHEIYSTAAEASRLAGNIQQMERYVTICLTAERSRPMETKYQVYYTMANGLLYGSQDRYEEAKTILLYLLKHLDCPFPTSVVASKTKIIFKLFWLFLTKETRTSKDLEAQQFMSDPAKKEAMKLLSKLNEVCYITKDELLLPLAIFTGLDYTYRYGLNIHSPHFAASASILLVGVLNDLKGGGMYAIHALELMKKVNHRPIEAATLLGAYAFGLHWTIHAKDCVAPLKYGYRVGLMTGDVENGIWCIFQSIWFLWQQGKPLPDIDSECRAYVTQMREMGNAVAWALSNALWKIIRSLMGTPNHDLDASFPDDSEEEGTPLVKITRQAFARIEQGYMGEHEKCAESAVKHKSLYLKTALGAPMPPVDMALSAVSCVEMARQTGNNIYLREAKRLRKWIVSWAQQDNPNLQHWKALLDAEFAALYGRKKSAIRRFQRSVDLALKGGYIHDAAIANERWGTYALHVLGNEKEAETRLKAAVELCYRWGALTKVRQLKENFPAILQSHKRSGA